MAATADINPELSLDFQNLSITSRAQLPHTEPALALTSNALSPTLKATNGASTRLGERNRLQIPVEEQRIMLSRLEAVFESAEENEGGVGVSELRSWSVDDDASSENNALSRVESLRRVAGILNQMWASNSAFLERSAEVLADASRQRERTISTISALGRH
jgi:hypothetical protein